MTILERNKYRRGRGRNLFTPKFDEKGSSVITVEDSTNEILMHGYSNKKLYLKQSKPTKLVIGVEEKNLEKR